MRLRTFVAATLLVSAVTAVAYAQGNSQGRGQGQGQGQGQGNSTPPAAAVSATIVFGEPDRVAFRNYFVTHRITAQPLPPGIAKNVARGKPLPPGIAKKALPADLLLIAPKVDRDVYFSIVGDVVVAVRGGIVIDVLAGVFK
jgi:hypothetical protein